MTRKISSYCDFRRPDRNHDTTYRLCAHDQYAGKLTGEKFGGKLGSQLRLDIPRSPGSEGLNGVHRASACHSARPEIEPPATPDLSRVRLIRQNRNSAEAESQRYRFSRDGVSISRIGRDESVATVAGRVRQRGWPETGRTICGLGRKGGQRRIGGD